MSRLVPLQPENVPSELRVRNQWVCWRLERDGPRRTKVPYQVSGAKASPTDPGTWTTFETALRALLSGGKFDGIGFVLTADDPYVCLDLDHVRDDTGVITSDAIGIIKMFASYTEVSPSGTGIHISVKGGKPGPRCRIGSIEIYGSKRFIAVTGAHVPETPTVIEERQAALDALYTEIPPAPSPRTRTTRPQRARLDDAALLKRMFASKSGERIRRLWIGDASGYPSASEADLALCAHLACWTRDDPDRMDRLFRRSGLSRPKWDRALGDTTYGKETIAKAIATNAGTVVQVRPSRTSTAKERFGALVEVGDDVPVGPALRYRRDLGLSNGEITTLLGLLTHYRVPDDWRSFSQDRLARDLGVGRPALNTQFARLRRLGHLATRPDHVHRPKPGLSPTLYYCLAPTSRASGCAARRTSVRRSPTVPCS